MEITYINHNDWKNIYILILILQSKYLLVAELQLFGLKEFWWESQTIHHANFLRLKSYRMYLQFNMLPFAQWTSSY